jgi:type I restriction enzyme, R subunit
MIMAANKKQNEAFSRIRIDAQLKDVGWNLADGICVLFEYVLPGKLKADYLLCDRNGHALAVIEAKRASISVVEAEGQALEYARLAKVPFIFLANGEEIWFWDYQNEAHPHRVTTFFSQADLERRNASRTLRRDPLDCPIDPKIAGRDYQKDCIDSLCKAINQGRRKLLVEMATGTGKTRTAAALIKRLFEANRITRVLFLVDRIHLATQTVDEAFTEYLADYPAYVLKRGRFQDEKRVTVTTLQSMINIYRDYSAGYFDLIITDECHRSIYGQWSGILRWFDGIQIGLTATPCQVPQSVLDNLADPEDAAFVRDTLRFFELDAPTFRYTLKQAIADGYLVPYHIYHAQTVKTAAKEGFEVERQELPWQGMNEAERAELEAVFGDKQKITVDPNALERKFTIPERNRAMVREFRQVMEQGYAGPDGVRRKPLEGKTIVFAVTKRHAETLAQMFDHAFADRKPDPSIRYADFVVSGLSGDDDTSDAASRIKRFKREAFPQIMVSVNMLDTGFDYPDVVNLVMARFTKSAILYQQMRGRGARGGVKVKKPFFTLFDFVGVADFHGDDETPPEGGFFVRERPGAYESQPRRLLVLDVNDHIDPATRGWITLDEDGNEVRTSAGERRAAELGVRFETWLLAQAFNSEQRRLLGMIDQQIKANALTLETFGAERFVDPPFSHNGGIERAMALFGGMAGLEAMLADLNQAVFSQRPPESLAKGEAGITPGVATWSN